MTRHVQTVPANPGWRVYIATLPSSRTPSARAVIAWRLITDDEGDQFALPICLEPLAPLERINYITDPHGGQHPIGPDHRINKELVR